MLAAFHTNLTALSWIALIVGLFLVYNTVTISVVARRQEIGTLRALGLTRRKVLALFLGEAAALAVAGIALGLGAGAAARGCRGRHDGVDGQHALYRHGRGAAGDELGPRRPGGGDRRCRSRCWPPPFRRSKPAACRRRRRCAGTTRSTCALRLRAGDAGRAGDRARRSPTAWRLLPAVGRRPMFGYASSFAIVIGAALLVPAIMFGLARRQPRHAAPAPGRRGPARARQPDRGDSAAVDLGRGAVGEPGDDGGDRGDDRQLPRHGGLLGGPDAEGRPVHRPRHPADHRLRPDGVARGDRRGANAIPTWSRSIRFATSISSTTATSPCSAPARSTSC